MCEGFLLTSDAAVYSKHWHRKSNQLKLPVLLFPVSYTYTWAHEQYEHKYITHLQARVDVMFMTEKMYNVTIWIEFVTALLGWFCFNYSNISGRVNQTSLSE